jgi:hypothetical protein
VVDRDTVVGIMVGDLQRIRVYAQPSHNFQVPMPIPEQVWQAYQALVAAGFVMNVMQPEQRLDWEASWFWTEPG